MRFSDRYSHTSPRNVLQIDNIDDSLRNALWNVIDEFFCRGVCTDYYGASRELQYNDRARAFEDYCGLVSSSGH
jgi:hypothetical protein